ncbi:MAG: AAA domain-containing protein [Alphaproteobacteria bacterium]|nr:AAA domain-containing protein [Alphaproteobacteria bacterium]
MRPPTWTPSTWPCGSTASPSRAASTCGSPTWAPNGRHPAAWERLTRCCPRRTGYIAGKRRCYVDLSGIEAVCRNLKQEIGKAVIGQDEAVDLLLTALLARGHMLLEGVPGTAKTLLVQSFAAALSLDFGRIQFTPDLMTGDVIGTNLFNFQTNEFRLTKGPIFTQILLGDEINRTPPKTQAALLEAMQERGVTIDGVTYPLGDEFLVVATQNPIEQQGTYPLPEAQLDRFLFKHVLGYPSRDEERQIVARHGTGGATPKPRDLGVTPLIGGGDLATMRDAVTRVRLHDDVVDYVVDVVRATREHPSLEVGASPRAATAVAVAARAYAAMKGRDYVIPDDVKALAAPALQHRLVLSPAAEIEGLTAAAVIGQVVDQVAAPR